MGDGYAQMAADLLLAEVPSDKAFNLRGGSSIRSLKELYSSLAGMDDGVFYHHVNGERNDFGNWVRDVHKDYKLANSLFAAKSRSEVASAVGARVYELEKAAEQSRNASSLSEETASERLEKILSEAARAKFEIAPDLTVRESRKVTAQELISESVVSDPGSEIVPGGLLGGGSRQPGPNFFSEVSLIFSRSAFSELGESIRGIFTRKQDDGLKFMQELSAFSSYSWKDDAKKDAIIAHLKKVYK